jgi:acetyl esterase/lipase
MESCSLNLFNRSEDENSNPVKIKQECLNIKKDIHYLNNNCYENTLDVLIPENIDETQKLPVVMHVHGGGWQRGHKDHNFYGAPFVGSSFMKSGFVSVVINYRKTTHPSGIDDVAAAIKWVTENIHGYNGDRDKLFLSGHSAGAHLVSLVSTQHAYLEKHDLDVSIIKGVIAISGIYNVGNPLSANHNDWTNKIYRSIYVEPIFGKDADTWSKASPFTHAQDLESHKIPPFMIINASNDFGLESDGNRFHELLRSKEIPFLKYLVIKNTHHQSVSLSQEVIDNCLEFIYDVLSG